MDNVVGTSRTSNTKLDLRVNELVFFPFFVYAVARRENFTRWGFLEYFGSYVLSVCLPLPARTDPSAAVDAAAAVQLSRTSHSSKRTVSRCLHFT